MVGYFLRGVLAAVAVLTLVAVGPSALAADNAPAKKGRISIHVVDSQGAALGGASVSLFDFDQDWRRWKRHGDEARTDAKGAAAFDDLETGTSYLVSRGDGRRPRGVPRRGADG